MLEFIANIGHISDIKSLKLLLKFAKESGFNFAKIDGFSVDEQFNDLFSDSIGMSVVDYEDIFTYADSLGISLYGSCYDYKSVDLFSNYTNICEVPVEKIDDMDFIRYVKNKFRYLILKVDNSDLDLIKDLYYSFGPHLIIYEPIRNLRKLSGINKIRHNLGILHIGFCDNSEDPIPTIVATTQGISYIEKSVTLDRNLFGHRHIYALEPSQFESFIKKVRYASSLV